MTKGRMEMRGLRKLLVATLLTTLTCGTAGAAPTVDAAKGRGPSYEWMTTTKFSTLYGEVDGAHTRWQGYGSYDEARSVLSYALRSAGSLYSDQDRYNHLMQAARDASARCGESLKYKRVIDVMILACDATKTYRDGAEALRAGFEYLISGQGGTETQSILRLGLSMTRPAMSSFESAYKMLFKVITASRTEAQAEDRQWHSVLSFTEKGADQTKSWRNGYLVLERISHVVAGATPGQPVFLRALAAIAGAGLDNAEDTYKVILAGIRQYQQDVPAPNHRALAGFLATAADKIKTWNAAASMLINAVTKMADLDMNVSAKVLPRAGLELSGGAWGTVEDRCTTAIEALRAMRGLDVPAHLRYVVDAGIRDADAARTWDEGLRMARTALDECLRRWDQGGTPNNGW